MDLKNTFGELVDKLRRQRPVIHEITNYVTAESCADVALAAGASPVMADEPEEVEEITAGADALVLNLGTISFNKQIAMERAVAVAAKKGIPVILDPVGVMTSTMRLNFALQLLNKGVISIVRGNYSECNALLLGKTGGHGVDNLDETTDEGQALRLAKDAASKFNCVFAVTGAVDNISNGKQAVVLNNGHPLLQDITGSGCMTSTLVACCAAITKDMLVAAALGVVIMGQSAELAANFLEKKDGPGMFKVRLMDCVYHVTTKWNLVNLKPEEKVS
ncbi:hydroxyethylthiazole kinase [Phascolarctobacterium sp.]|uniref:hydroxyethylthiazole kinase n=1 Tax=Phascolarctobacterium sp. TaxID=2049039 RepID=UPI00386708F5